MAVISRQNRPPVFGLAARSAVKVRCGEVKLKAARPNPPGGLTHFLNTRWMMKHNAATHHPLLCLLPRRPSALWRLLAAGTTGRTLYSSCCSFAYDLQAIVAAIHLATYARSGGLFGYLMVGGAVLFIAGDGLKWRKLTVKTVTLNRCVWRTHHD